MKNSKPLVSVLIPSYNHQLYIEEAIESVINQTYQNIELIVIDDGSNDDSVAIITELQKKHPFKFIVNKNKGLTKTMNEAILLSKGKYFCGCASDDKMVFDKIEKQVIFMEANPQFAMTYGNMIIFDEHYEKKQIVKNAKSGMIFEEILKASIVIPALTFMVKTNVLKEVGLYDPNLFIDDWDMWLKISNKYEIGYINEYLGYYRKHETNNSKNILKMYESQKIILNKWKDDSSYNIAMKHWEIDWFNRLSRNYKKEAVKYVHIVKYIFQDFRIVKGFIKLLFIWR